jgi:phospholipase/lecithinase/hemolysin
MPRPSLAVRLTVFAMACCALAARPSPSQAAESYKAIYVFGDSLSDAGNDWIGTLGAEPKSPPYYKGHFSNGLTWVEDLSSALRLGVLKPSIAGGHDFAFGGAESGPTLVHTLSETPPDLPWQVIEFKAQVPKPAADALYVLWIGSNDLFDMLGHNPALTPAQLAKGIKQVVANETGAIAALAAFAAPTPLHLLVLTAPDLGKVPGVASQGAVAAAAGSALAATFDAALTTAVQAEAQGLGITLTVVDAYTTMDTFISNPSTYGFTDVIDPCWTGTYAGTGGTVCSKLKSVQNQHLFWDQVHPTASAHSLIAATVKSQLP